MARTDAGRAMRDNYLSAGEHIRNIADLPGTVEVLEEHGLFRIVRLPAPFVSGCEIWVVNEKGFLWEPARDVQAARDYLTTDEASSYEGAPV